jgi:hypothetical protein
MSGIGLIFAVPTIIIAATLISPERTAQSRTRRAPLRGPGVSFYYLRDGEFPYGVHLLDIRS